MDVPVLRRLAGSGFGRGALLAPAALAVHQLRYLLTYGGGAGVQLRETGHSYLHSLVPWVIAVIAVAAGCFLVSLGRAFSQHTRAVRFGLSFSGLWLACTGALIGIFIAQELLEGFLAMGHPGGLTGVFGYGGWWAIPAAACVGLVLAALFHGARWVLEQVVLRRHAAPRRRGPDGAHRPRPVRILLPAPLLAGWSTRGPPGRR